MTWSCFSVCLALLGAQQAAAQNPLDLVGQGGAPPFMHSSGLYQFQPPGGWYCRQLRDGAVECTTNNGANKGVCTITHLLVEGHPDSELMALNAEKEFKKLPHYRKTGGGRLLLGANKASIRSFVFDYQNNVEYPVAVEELYVVSGGRAVRVHFETMMVSMPSYVGDLHFLYDNFSLADVDANGQVVEPAQKREKSRPSDADEKVNKRYKQSMEGRE